MSSTRKERKRARISLSQYEDEERTGQRKSRKVVNSPSNRIQERSDGASFREIIPCQTRADLQMAFVELDFAHEQTLQALVHRTALANADDSVAVRSQFV